MMTLLNEVKLLVNPVLADKMLEAGYNELTIEEGNLAIDIEYNHYVDWTDKYGVMHCVVAPKKVLVYVADENGDYSNPVDMTGEFNEYKYKLYS